VIRLPKEVTRTLDETGLSWRVEGGTKHYKIRMAGRIVGVYPQGTVKESNGAALRNMVARIRRTARELKQ
jgi:hypothetical protein